MTMPPSVIRRSVRYERREMASHMGLPGHHRQNPLAPVTISGRTPSEFLTRRQD